MKTKLIIQRDTLLELLADIRESELTSANQINGLIHSTLDSIDEQLDGVEYEEAAKADHFTSNL